MHAITTLPKPCFISVYRDAGANWPWGARWKALFVSAPGELVGGAVWRGWGNEAEFMTMREAIAFCEKEHGAAFGDVFRVFLPRYEGLEGYYKAPARFFANRKA